MLRSSNAAECRLEGDETAKRWGMEGVGTIEGVASKSIYIANSASFRNGAKASRQFQGLCSVRY